MIEPGCICHCLSCVYGHCEHCFVEVRRSNVEKLLRMKQPDIRDVRLIEIPEPKLSLEEFLKGKAKL